MSKESIYDERINPLMAQIIEICKEHKIAMLADFMLDDDLKCTSALLADDFEPSESQIKAYDLLKPKRTFALAETTQTMPDGTTHISIRRIS